MRQLTRCNVLTTIALLSMMAIAESRSFAQTGTEPYADIPKFRPRTDEQAAQDTQSLRERLSKVSDSLGPVNVLGDYVRNEARSLSDRGGDRESERKPSLDAKPKEYQSANAAVSPPRDRGIVLLPGPRFTIIQPVPSNGSRNLAANDGFRPSRLASDREAIMAPSLQNPVTYASANVPIMNLAPQVIARYQPDIPSTGGMPGPMSGFPGSSTNILPNASPPIMPPPTGTLNAQPGAFSPPAPVYNVPPYGAPGVPMGTAAPPMMNPQPAPGVMSTPLPGSGAPGVVGNPGTMMPAPQPYYPQPGPMASGPMVGAPTAGGPMPAAPMVSPSDSTLPRYPRAAPFVNGPPFVSGPPCQFDASYMVSPRAYRPNVDSCGPGGYAPSPYATRPTGSPFTYIPPTGMAANYRNPPFPILIGFGQNLNNAYLSRGIIGQPTAYVDGQPIRNFLRYLSP
ncbi:MAG: hypothetical protein ABL921_10360 [Pirellula sp.]